MAPPKTFECLGLFCTLAGVLLSVVACGGRSDGTCAVIDPKQGVDSEILAYFAEHNPDWLNQTRRCVVGDYVVYGPSDPTNRNLVITNSAGSVVAIDRGAVYVFENDRIVVSVLDQDSDGLFDHLDYDVFNENGHLLVEDRDLDGQADFKVLFRNGEESEPSMWYDGAWRRIDWGNAPNPNLMLIDETWRPYRIDDGEVTFLDETG